MKRASFARVALAIALVVVASACARAKKAEPTPAGALRVVSLSPSTTETLFAIGAGDRVVGRSRYCDYPDAALALPQVGGYVDPSLEAILALRPDLVVGARGPAGTKYSDALGSHGIATYFPETESLAAVDVMIRGIGERTGHASEAGAEVARIDAKVAAIAHAAEAAGPRPRVLLVFGLEPIVVAGPGGFPDEMIAKAGGVNVVSVGTAYPTMGVERVIALDPDVILDATIMETHASTRIASDAPGWREVRAVKLHHVQVLTGEAVLRPGPRIDQGLEQIASAIRAGR